MKRTCLSKDAFIRELEEINPAVIFSLITFNSELTKFDKHVNCDCPCKNLYKRSANANAFVSNAVRPTGNEGECTKV